MSSLHLAFAFGAAFAQEEPTETAPAQPAAPEQPTEAPPPPSPPSPPSPPPPPPSAEAPAPPPEGPRNEGLRLGLDLGFWRSSGEEPTRVNAGSPSLIPLGADVSWRTSRRVLLGVHGHAGLASRDDCLGDTGCTGRGYGLGAHVEVAFSSSRVFVPYFRYGIGWEMVHQIAAFKNGDAYRYRHAFDVLDVRFGGDFVVARGKEGRTTRIGPFVGMIVGLGVDEVSSGRVGREPDFGSGHMWFVLGARGTTDW